MGQGESTIIVRNRPRSMDTTSHTDPCSISRHTNITQRMVAVRGMAARKTKAAALKTTAGRTKGARKALWPALGPTLKNDSRVYGRGILESILHTVAKQKTRSWLQLAASKSHGFGRRVVDRPCAQAILSILGTRLAAQLSEPVSPPRPHTSTHFSRSMASTHLFLASFLRFLLDSLSRISKSSQSAPNGSRPIPVCSWLRL